MAHHGHAGEEEEAGKQDLSNGDQDHTGEIDPEALQLPALPATRCLIMKLVGSKLTLKKARMSPSFIGFRKMIQRSAQ
jgi:hypothetical protein